ncbi:hypothetical protein F2P81_022932 [Scophthalmus maximus]|uniref:Uncharacterized protein n=1 Tax=Scophthalmus maximus TaxID=52904 RepID=A0A6A4RXT6_SCOMX|nr:hypothetical protein F2P81_022932 [Scophthalmus maximus]
MAPQSHAVLGATARSFQKSHGDDTPVVSEQEEGCDGTKLVIGNRIKARRLRLTHRYQGDQRATHRTRVLLFFPLCVPRRRSCSIAPRQRPNNRTSASRSYG